MIIEFKVKNFLSFKNETVFSMVQSLGNENKNNIYQDLNLALPKKVQKKSGILKSALIFGANGSGKSNLLKSIDFVKAMILKKDFSPNTPIYDHNFLGPFLLNSETENQPSEFDITFEVENSVYNYKFSLNREEILHEELKQFKKGIRVIEKPLFRRDNKNGIALYDFDDLGVSNRVLRNSLALAKFASENVPEALKINKFFHNLFVFTETTQDIDTMEMLKIYGEEFKGFLLNLLGTADNSIKDLSFNMEEIPELPLDILEALKAQNIPIQVNNKFTKIDFYLQHDKYDDGKNLISKVNFALGRESLGTRKLYQLAGSLFNVLKNGMILFIDEIDTNLSSNLVWSIIRSVNDQKISSKRPQIIFTSHDTGLLDIKELLRRDQIWFAGKNTFGESTLMPLINYKTLTRKDTSVEKEFKLGGYGGFKRVKGNILKK